MELAHVLEVTEDFARKWRLNQDQTDTARILAWLRWSQRKEDWAAEIWAVWACRQARAGRDLPGLGTKKRGTDALDYAWQGASMDEVVDRSPGPDVLASDAERMEQMLARMNAAKRTVMLRTAAGVRNMDIAQEMGLTPARVSQIRREIFKEWEG